MRRTVEASVRPSEGRIAGPPKRRTVESIKSNTYWIPACKVVRQLGKTKHVVSSLRGAIATRQSLTV